MSEVAATKIGIWIYIFTFVAIMIAGAAGFWREWRKFRKVVREPMDGGRCLNSKTGE